ncbi:MAG: hypothetical protein AABZ12_10830 [Planctomycetota bacterium]
MKHKLLSILVSMSALAGSARATDVLFDFNSLNGLSRDSAISEYMTGVYGSAVTTGGARASNQRGDEPTGNSNFFIATSLQLFSRGDFEILFADVPILGASFEGHVLDPTTGEDFSVTAFQGDTVVFQYTRDAGVEIVDSGWLAFNSPVDRLVVSDNGRKDVGIDNLLVQPVPDPATALLLVVGAVATVRRRRSV